MIKVCGLIAITTEYFTKTKKSTKWVEKFIFTPPTCIQAYTKPNKEIILQVLIVYPRINSD